MSARLVTLGSLGQTENQDAQTWWDWILEQGRAWLDLGPAIYDLAHQAAHQRALAIERGDQEAAEQARLAVIRIMDLWRRHQDLSDRLRPILGAVGLGLLPWVALGYTAAAVIVLGAGMRWISARFGAERAIVDLLEAGQVTAEQAERLLAEADAFRPPGIFGTGIPVWVVLGGLAFLAWRSL